MTNTKTYQTDPKQKWRTWVHNLVTQDNSAFLTDDEGNFLHKWVELVGPGCHTFDQLLKTNRITEDKLVGINLDEQIINESQTKFPMSNMVHTKWDTFCRTYQGNDIGVIVYDSFNAAHGKDLRYNIDATMSLAMRCKDNIGECLVVINVDSKTTRRQLKNDPREQLKLELERYFKSHPLREVNEIELDIEHMMEYQQTSKSDHMLSVGILL